MTLSESIRVLEEAAARGVQFRAGQPTADQWGRIRREYDALPTGARWQLEYLGYPVILVNGPLRLIANLGSIADVVKGFTSQSGCCVSVPSAYPDGTTTTSRVVPHEVGHVMDLVENQPAWPYSRQADWLAINAANGWGDPGESWPEQFAWWCLYERYGWFESGMYPTRDVRDYFRAKARARGWYWGDDLYFPRG